MKKQEIEKENKIMDWFKDNYWIFILFGLEILLGYIYTGHVFGVLK